MKAMAITLNALVMILALAGSSGSASLACDGAPWGCEAKSFPRRPRRGVLTVGCDRSQLGDAPPAPAVELRICQCQHAEAQGPDHGRVLVYERRPAHGALQLGDRSLVESSIRKNSRASLNCCASSGDGDHQGSTSELNGDVGSSAA